MDSANGKPSGEPSGKPRKPSAAPIPQPHGGALVPGAGGGPQPGSGRPRSAFKAFLKQLREDPEAQAAIERAAKDAGGRSFAAAWKVITDYDDTRPGTKVEHSFNLTKEQREQRVADLLTTARQRASSNGNGNGNGHHATNGNGSHG